MWTQPGAIVALLGLFVLLQCPSNESTDSPLPYKTVHPDVLPHLLKYDTAPVAPNPAEVRQKIDSLPSTFLPQTEWPDTSGQPLGTVTAVAFDNDRNVVVFHRGSHVWTSNTFDMSNRYRGDQTQPIAEPTLIAYRRSIGTVAYTLGRGIFFMPHGLTIDRDGAFYVTDVALHQVIKLRRSPDQPDQHIIEWSLGTPFEPGNTDVRLCKPTGVAVLDTGDFFVSDGYCNARILKFSKAGVKLLAWGVNSFSGLALPVAPPNYFAIPHALTLAADRGWLCVADREHGRVQCFDLDGTFKRQFHSPLIGDRLFSVAYAPIAGGRLYVVNGPDFKPVHETRVLGFVLDVTTGNVIEKFSPVSVANGNRTFSDPHDVIVSDDGLEIYVADLNNATFKLVSADLELYDKKLDLKYDATAAIGERNAAAGAIADHGLAWILASTGAVVVAAVGLLFVLVMRIRRTDGNGTLNDVGSLLRYSQLAASTELTVTK